MKPPPRLKAKFVLDASGTPAFVDDGGTKHYKLIIDVEDDDDAHTSAVYQLDPSYWDPVRETRRSEEGSFPEPITSYGDFEIVARMSGSAGRAPVVSGKLSELLRREYADAKDEAITSAIENISKR